MFNESITQKKGNPMDFKKLSVMMLVSVVMMPQVCFGLVGSRVNVTHNIAVGELFDGSGNAIVQASVGAIGSNPNTWTVTTLNDGFSTTNNQTPRLYTSVAGDVVVVWIFTDSNQVAQLCAATLLSGETTWHIANVSQSVGSAVFGDGFVSINNAGDALIVWSAQDLISGNTVILGSTTNLFNDPIVWSAPFVILQS